jgi:hypothetical protein
MDEVEDRISFHRHDRLPDDKEQPNPKKLAAGETLFVAGGRFFQKPQKKKTGTCSSRRSTSTRASAKC